MLCLAYEWKFRSSVPKTVHPQRVEHSNRPNRSYNGANTQRSERARNCSQLSAVTLSMFVMRNFTGSMYGVCTMYTPSWHTTHLSSMHVCMHGVVARSTRCSTLDIYIYKRLYGPMHNNLYQIRTQCTHSHTFSLFDIDGCNDDRI